MDLTDIVPQLDLYDRNWPIWTFAEISPPAKFVHDQEGRRGQAVSSLVSGGCIVSGATVRQSLLFTNVHMRSYSHVENAVILPDVEIGRRARLNNVIIDRGVRIPAGLVVGEDPELDAARFRRTEGGICLITQPMIDKLSRMTGIKVLAVASEIYPLVKTGGLADVAGALPRALRKHGVETVTLVPGYPAVKAALGHADEVLAVDDLFGGRARVLAAQVGGLDLFVLDAPHLFGRPGNPYVADDGRDWPDNAFRFGALGWIAARIGARRRRRASRPTFSTATTGRPGSRWPISPMAAGRRPATVITVHNLAYQGQFPADLLDRLRPSAAGLRDRRRRALRCDRLSQGRPATRRSHHDGFADLCAGDPDRRRRLRPRRAAARSRRRVVRHPQRDRCRRLESGDRHADRRRASSRSSLPSRSPNKAELQRRFGLAQRSRTAAVRGREPARLAQGDRPPGRRGPRAGRASARSSWCWEPASPNWSTG